MSGRERFQVDLRGVLDVLSHHLYSSPTVYLRELLQNAVDAITARREDDPDAPARVVLVPADVSPDGALHLTDSGIGLDDDGIRQVLSTIGSTSKRDDLGVARETFLGQFGIGLLSCFLVTDGVELVTRTVDGTTWHWHGRSDGTYAVTEAEEARSEAGTEVVVRPRADDRRLLESEVVLSLARRFARHLPVDLLVETAGGPVSVAGVPFAWEGGEDPEDLGFVPFDRIRLEDEEAGLTGMAWVLPTALAGRPQHQIHAKRMYVGASPTGVLPDWAFFLRTSIDTSRLRLTASREALHDDELLAGVRERLGATIRAWLRDLATRDPSRAGEFLTEHHLAAKAMALQDDEMLDIVAELLAWETTTGQVNLADLREAGVVSYVTSTEDFRQVLPLARALDLTVLNAGYAYDQQVLRRWFARTAGAEGRQVSPSDLTTELTELEAGESERFAPLLDVALTALDRAQCRPVIRSFHPARLPSVLLGSRDARRQQDRAAVLESTSGPWAAALRTRDRPDERPAFVLNAANASVQLLADVPDVSVQRAGVEALYAQALFAGQHPLRPFDSALVARALPTLIDLAIGKATT